jgi:hypothetical protein
LSRECGIFNFGYGSLCGKGQFLKIIQENIYFNLGEISEDVLKMGKQYENGLGPDHWLIKTDLGRCSCLSLNLCF